VTLTEADVRVDGEPHGGEGLVDRVEDDVADEV
jgi:hypothetical protein